MTKSQIFTILSLENKKQEGKLKITIAFVLIYPEKGKETDIIRNIRKLALVEEVHICYFDFGKGDGKGELMVIAKLSALNITEKELIKFAREEIRGLDMVQSTGTMMVVRPEDKFEPIDENLIAEEKENWGP